MSDLANEGVAILMISSELPEILGMSDRVIVMHQGRITGDGGAWDLIAGRVAAIPAYAAMFAEVYPERTLLCDRGTLDGAAYWPDGDGEFLASLGSSIEEELAGRVAELGKAGMQLEARRLEKRTRSCRSHQRTHRGRRSSPTISPPTSSS